MIESIINDIKSCDDVILATVDNTYPDLRHLTNIMNQDITNLDLFFMTSINTQKYTQLHANPKCTLYYFNYKTRHALRLFGHINFITDKSVRHVHWQDDYKQFGYEGPDGANFVLMQFITDKYKICIGNTTQIGTI